MKTIEQRFNLQGKVALVTGASSGLGAHFALTLASAGATVIAAARRKEKLQQLVKDIEDAGGRAFAIAMDVTSASSVAAASVMSVLVTLFSQQ